MKPLKATVSFFAAALLTFNVSAYQVITDEALFYSLLESPTHTIDFTRLKDGSTFLNASVSPLVATTNYLPLRFEVREVGWTDRILIGSTNPNCACAWTATFWYGTYINPDFYDHIYVNTRPTNQYDAIPVAINDGADFVGFIPDDAQDGFFLMPRGNSVDLLRFGFAPVAQSQVPEPGTLALLALGLAGLRLSRRIS